MTQHSVRPLLDFIAGSPSCYHVIANTAAELTAAGYVPLPEGERWTLAPGGRYFVTRDSSPHRLPCAGDPYRRLHDGRRPQRLPRL